MVDTRSNIQLSDLSSKPHGEKSLQIFTDCSIGAQLYTPPGSLHHHLLQLGQFHGPTHINLEQKKKINMNKAKISSARNRNKKSSTDKIIKYRSFLVSLYVRT